MINSASEGGKKKRRGVGDRASDRLEIHQAGWRGWERERTGVSVERQASPGHGSLENGGAPVASCCLTGEEAQHLFFFFFSDRLGQASC